MTFLLFLLRVGEGNQKKIRKEKASLAAKCPTEKIQARVETIRKTTNGHHQLALALTHHGVREKRKKTSGRKISETSF